jgi:hypothetical protein
MFRRALLFIAAILLFVLGIGLIVFLLNMPSGKEKKAWERIRQQETALSRTFDVVIVQSGFLKRSTGKRDIYIPALLVRTTNMSDAPSKETTLNAWFGRKGNPLCAARSFIPALKPGGSQEVWMKCVELTGFGSIARGLTLAETTETVDVEVYLGSRDVSVLVTKSTLGQRIL